MTSERNHPAPGNPLVPGAQRISPRDDSMVPSRVIAVQDDEPVGPAPGLAPAPLGASPRQVTPPPRPAAGSAMARPSLPPRPRAPQAKDPLAESFALPQRVVEAGPDSPLPTPGVTPGQQPPAPAPAPPQPAAAVPAPTPQAAAQYAQEEASRSAPYAPPSSVPSAPAPRSGTPAIEVGEDTAPDNLLSPYGSAQIPAHEVAAEAQPQGVQVVPPRAPPAPQRAAPPQPAVAIADSAEASDPALSGLEAGSEDPFDDWLEPAPIGAESGPASSSARQGRVITQRPRGLRRPRGQAQTWLIRGVYLASLLAIGFVGVQSARDWMNKREQQQQALQAMPPVRPTASEADRAAQALRPLPSEAPRVARGSVDSEPHDEWQQAPIAAHTEGLEAESGDDRYEGAPEDLEARALEASKGSVRMRSALPADPAARVPRNQAKRLGTADYEPGAGQASVSQLVERASQKVVDGDLEGALRIYEELARRWPEEPSHAAMVRALRTKLDKQ